jgi:hypothetical protein
MSVLITVKFHGDTAIFLKAVAERTGEFARIAEKARANGGIHHRFGVGDGCVLVVDEWETAEDFETFFGDPDLQAFIGSAGADAGVAPEITVVEAIESADQY